MFYERANRFLERAGGDGAVERTVRFLRDRAAGLADGRHELDAGIFVSIRTYSPRPAGENRYETHVRYADVQYVIEGGETIYACPVEGLAVTEDRLEKDDVRFHADPPDGAATAFTLRPGDFILLAPEDAHRPECAAGFATCRKAVAKIPVGLLMR